MIGELPQFVHYPEPEVYLSDNYIVFDFETTTLDRGSALNPENRAVSVCWSYGPDHPLFVARDTNVHYRRGNEYELGELVQGIEQAKFCIAHNAKFDLQWAERCGLDLGDVRCVDTMIAEYVLGGNKWVFWQLALDNIAKRRSIGRKDDLVSLMIKNGFPTEDIPERWLEKYCILDVELTEKIWLQQRTELAELNLLPVLYNRCLLTPVLADIEKNGMQLDAELVLERLDQVESEYGKMMAELETFTGGVNLNSRLELSEYLYSTLGIPERKRKISGMWVDDRTDSGQPKTDAETIAHLRPPNDKAAKFLEMYAAMKEKYNELTKYLRKFGDCISDDGGVLLAAFNQTSTQTHRLSSSGRKYATQLHNIPRAYKPLFKARNEGWLVGEADGAQLEFRVAAHLGRDAAALDDIVQGTDIHSVTADVIGCTRQSAKAHTFKPLYGGKSGTDDEKRYYQFFREKYEGITKTQQNWIDSVLSNGYLTTEWGLRYYWPGTKITESGYVTNSTSICNYPVQAFATAEIIPLALVCFWHRVRRSDLRMMVINTVHDSIIAEFPKEETEAFHALAEQCLIDDVYSILRVLYGIDLTVPLGAGVKVGSHWSGSDAPDFVPAGLTHDKGEVTYTAEEELWKDWMYDPHVVCSGWPNCDLGGCKLERNGTGMV